MWEHFWEVPVVSSKAGLGFGQFGVVHITALLLLAALVAGISISYRRASTDRRQTMRRVLGSTIVGLEVLVQTMFITSGHYQLALNLPLHVCAISVFAVFIDAWWPNRWTREFAYSMTIWGALAALVLPDWADSPIWNICSLQSFTIHGLLVAYPVMLLVSGDLVPDWRQLWRPAIILAILVPAIMVVNSLLGANYWFLNSSVKGTPLEPILNATGPGYIPTLLGMLLALWFLMYLPWALRARHSSAN